MNIKPSGQQVEKWIAEASSEGGKILDPNKLAELAAKWGASQAQQTTADAGRVLEWMRTPNRKPANLAFTDGPERQAAYWIEIAQQRVAQQTTEPELPEPFGYLSVHKVEGPFKYQFNKERAAVYPDNAISIDAVFTATQMHDHFAAGVRAGMAQSQDGLSQIISGAIFDFAGYLTTRPNAIEVGSTANASPMADLVKEWAALRGLSLNDAAVLSWQNWLRSAMQGDQK